MRVRREVCGKRQDEGWSGTLGQGRVCPEAVWGGAGAGWGVCGDTAPEAGGEASVLGRERVAGHRTGCRVGI